MTNSFRTQQIWEITKLSANKHMFIGKESVLHAPDRDQDGIGVCNEAQAALYEPNADEAITISLMSGISLVPYSACRHACSDPEELDVWGPDRLHGIFTKERRFFSHRSIKPPNPCSTHTQCPHP